MNTYTEEVGKKLNALLEKTYDAENGFMKAAENAKDASLKAYFMRKSAERKQFGQELKTEIHHFGQETEESGSAAGAIHRTWMDVKAFFSLDNDESMLEAAITGETAAAKEYEQALKEVSLPTSTASLLTRQMSRIKSDLATIKTLEDIS
jgi:uncharacterized protein (TIGR02284 family)